MQTQAGPGWQPRDDIGLTRASPEVSRWVMYISPQWVIY